MPGIMRRAIGRGNRFAPREGARRCAATLEVEDLLESLVEPRRGVGERIDQLRHLRLPPIVDLGRGHRRPERGEVVDLEIGEEVDPVQEDRVVARSRRPQGIEHLRPDRAMAAPVFGLLARQESHREAHAFH
jgi:hypothetical protein